MATTMKTHVSTRGPLKSCASPHKEPVQSLVISESELRAFNRCSEFSFRGGRVDLNLRTAAIEFLYIGLVLDILRNPHFDFNFCLNRQSLQLRKHLKASNHSPEEIDDTIKHASLSVIEVFKTLPPHQYVPATGPFEYPIKVNKSILNMKVSSLLMTKPDFHTVKDPDYRSKSIHAVTFSPFNHPNDMKNDLVQQVKALTIGSASPLKNPTDSLKVRLHIFGSHARANQLGGVVYTYIEHRQPIDAKGWASFLEKPITLLESGFHYPVNPCPYVCPFKSQCYPNPSITKQEEYTL